MFSIIGAKQGNSTTFAGHVGSHCRRSRCYCGHPFIRQQRSECKPGCTDRRHRVPRCHRAGYYTKPTTLAGGGHNYLGFASRLSTQLTITDLTASAHGSLPTRCTSLGTQPRSPFRRTLCTSWAADTRSETMAQIPLKCI